MKVLRDLKDLDAIVLEPGEKLILRWAGQHMPRYAQQQLLDSIRHQLIKSGLKDTIVLADPGWEIAAYEKKDDE